MGLCDFTILLNNVTYSKGSTFLGSDIVVHCWNDIATPSVLPLFLLCMVSHCDITQSSA